MKNSPLLTLYLAQIGFALLNLGLWVAYLHDASVVLAGVHATGAMVIRAFALRETP